MLRNDALRYGAVSRTLHWLIAALMVAAYLIGDQSEDLPRAEASGILAIHALPGLVVLVLGLLRIGWRHLDPAPPLPVGLPGWELKAARFVHLGLLAIMLGLPLTGLASVLFGFRPFEIRWLGELAPVAGIGWLHEAAEGVHVALGKLFLVLLLAHVGAVVWHAFGRRYELLSRMLPVRPR